MTFADRQFNAKSWIRFMSEEKRYSIYANWPFLISTNGGATPQTPGGPHPLQPIPLDTYTHQGREENYHIHFVLGQFLQSPK